MALLRLEDGRIFTTLADINAQLAPMQIGAFPFDAAMQARVEEMAKPVSKESAEEIVAMLDEATRARFAEEGLASWRLGNVIDEGDDQFGFYLFYENGESGTGQQSGAAMRDYKTPHRDDVEDIHFVFSGAIIKGAVLESGVQGVVYVQAGEWIKVGSKAINWPVFPAGQSTIGLSFFNRASTSALKDNREFFADLAIKPGMAF
jgi:hypothetical protein